MNASDALESIAAAIVEYLQTVPGTPVGIDANTDLVASGALDSLLVMDLVCFVEFRFRVRMSPADISPETLRNATTIAHYVSERINTVAKAA